jgi:hypothetical protein
MKFHSSESQPSQHSQEYTGQTYIAINMYIYIYAVIDQIYFKTVEGAAKHDSCC